MATARRLRCDEDRNIYFIKLHAAWTILTHVIVIIGIMYCYFSVKTVPQSIVDSGFAGVLATNSFKYCLVGSIAIGFVVLLHFVLDMLEKYTEVNNQACNKVSQAREWCIRLTVVIGCLLMPSFSLFLAPDNDYKALLAWLVSDTRNQAIFTVVFLTMDSIGGDGINGWRQKMGMCSSVLFFSSWSLKYVWFFAFVLTEQIDTSVAVVVSQVANVMSCLSGILVVVCCGHTWNVIFQKCRRRAVSNDDWAFLIYSAPIIMGVIQYIAVAVNATRTSHDYFYWNTSLSDLTARELIVIVYALAGAIFPARLARYEARFFQVSLSPALASFLLSYCLLCRV